MLFVATRFCLRLANWCCMEIGFFFLSLLENQRGLRNSALAITEQILFFWWNSFLPMSFHLNSTSLVVVISWLLKLPLPNFLQFCLFPEASFRLSCVRKQTIWIMFFSVLEFFYFAREWHWCFNSSLPFSGSAQFVFPCFKYWFSVPRYNLKMSLTEKHCLTWYIGQCIKLGRDASCDARNFTVCPKR